MSGSPSRSISASTVRYAVDLGHVCAALAQLVGQHFARDVRARQKKPLALDVAQLAQRLHDRFGARFGRLEIDLEAVPREALGGRRADRDQLDALEIPDVAARLPADAA